MRDGKWFPIPGGAHVEHLKRNDIIFNADQTKELIKTGRVISGGGHGRVISSAYAQGTADRILNAYAVGNGGGGFAAGAATGEDGSGLDGAGQAITDFTNALDKGTGATQNNTDSTKKDTEEKEKSIETFDHIQTLLGRLSSKFEELGASLTEFSSRAKQTSVALKQMSNTKQQYNANVRAMKEYAREAEGVTYTKTENDQEVTYALPEEWKQKIRDGAFSIEDVDFTDNEELKEAIEEYQEWYEKMLDCRQAMEELKAQQVELYDQWLQIPLDAVNNKIEKYTSNLNNVSSATEALIANNSEAVQSILALSNAGQQALDNLGYGMVVEGEYSPKEQIQIANSSVADDVQTKKKIANEAQKAVKRTTEAVTAQQKNYDTANKNVSSRANKILKKSEYQGLLTKEQRTALSKGKTVSLDGVDPNSAFYNSLTAFNRLVDKRDVAQEKLTVAKTKQTEANQTYDEAINEWAVAQAEAPGKRLENINTAWDAQRNNTSALIEQEKTSRLSDTDKIRESDYNNIIKYADQDAVDAKAQADAYEKEMNKQIKSGKLSGSARQEAENTLANLRTEQKNAEDAALNYRLEAKEVNVTQSNRESEKANTAIEQAQAKIELKRAKGVKISANDYKSMQENANKDIGIQQNTINQLKELQSMVERGSDKWRDYQDQIDAANEAIIQQKINLEEWEDEIDQIELTQLSRESQKANTAISNAQAEMQLKESRGEKVEASDYLTMQKNATQDIKIQNERIAKLKEMQSEVKRGSDKWREYQDQIDEANKAILQQEQNLENWADQIKQIRINDLQLNIDNAQRLTAQHDASRSLKEIMGFELNESDYRQMIADSQNEQKAQEQLKAELLSQQAATEVGGAEWKNYQSQIDACDNAIRQAQQSQLKYNVEINNLPINRLKQELDLLDAIADSLKAQVELKAAAGKDLSVSDYTSQMSSNSSIVSVMMEESYAAYQKYKDAVENGGAVDGMTANEWKIMYLNLQAQADSVRAANEQLKDSLRDDVYWRDFERAHQAVQRLVESIKGMDNLISEDMYFDADGNVTDMGYTHMAAIIKQYENAREEVSNYTDDLNNLHKLYGRGEYTVEEYKEKFAELQQGLLNSAGDMKALEEEMISFYKEVGQIQLDSIMELIDARKEDLNRRKEAYDWAKRMEQSNKEVQNIDAQIAAYENLGDAANEATKAKLAQLKAQRKELQDQIDNDVQEHMFELSSQGLDDLKENLQEAFDESMENIGKSLSSIESIILQAKDVTQANLKDVNKALNALLKHYNIPTIANATQGFSTGGIVRDDKNSILANNDMTIARLNPGETILTSKFTNLMPNAVEVMEQLVEKSVNLNAVEGLKVQTPNITQITYDSLITVNGDVDKEVWPGLKKTVEESYKYMCAQNIKNAAALGIKTKFK